MNENYLTIQVNPICVNQQKLTIYEYKTVTQWRY
jgi:hypothetical protein